MTATSIISPDILIAELRQVRSRGLAREASETQPGIACVAAPISVEGVTVAAVSLAYGTDGGPPPQLESALLDTTSRIAKVSSHAMAEGREKWVPRRVPRSEYKPFPEPH
jgi:DNA-binding IclR family transcriptional regulator